MKKFAFLLAIPVLLLLWWAVSKKELIPSVRAATVTRRTIRSTIPTNGKVEPVEFASARAPAAGMVKKVWVERGKDVAAGAVLVTLDDTETRAAMESATARIQEVKAEIVAQAAGGRASELSEIENSLKSARLQVAYSQSNLDSLQRLAAKNAATQDEVRVAQDTLAKANLKITELEARRATLVSATDRTVSAAKLQAAEASADLARHRLEETVVKAPISGTVYQIDLKPGAYLQPGDVVATLGKLDQVRVRVYVDEPELGRVSRGVPVVITWEGRPDLSWTGRVDQMPTQIVPLGTRQVGEVLCLIDNPKRELLPGVNVNAEILSKVVKDAISIPKQALRYESRGKGVYKLKADNQVEWQPVSVGVSDINSVEILSGLTVGDRVVMPSDVEVKEGQHVLPILQ
jgi:HlyD family secretion protein